jgi:hypothetical protein
VADPNYIVRLHRRIFQGAAVVAHRQPFVGGETGEKDP